ncbi:uncharacterized protein LOC112637079 [Camponotus floridanus]|uniref:uncharacterized protein LOC112637079 n=1 Tax=Camponotus floridanus TaxID=104421 RepID=UPI000DC6664E|nr:uncharacterized protein LOC112637079 [Camponotus floridanus]
MKSFDKYFTQYFDSYMLYYYDNCIDHILEIQWDPNSNTAEKDVWMECFYMREGSDLQYPANINKTRRLVYCSKGIQNPLHDISEMIEAFKHKLQNSSNCSTIFYSEKFNQIMPILLQSFYELNIEERTDKEYRIIARSIKDRTETGQIQSKRRCKRIKFTIGMIVNIRTRLAKRLAVLLSEINCYTGVIIGWHYNCKAKLVKKKMNFLVPHLTECNNPEVPFLQDRFFCICRCEKSISSIKFKPHYIILAENNKLCYLPQDTLSICPPKCIDNFEIGRYFSKFEGTHYVPNENLAKEYPKDTAAIHDILPSISQQCA